MEHQTLFIVFLFLTKYFYICNGCQIEGINFWPVPNPVTIFDTHRGQFLNRPGSGIAAIDEHTFGEGLNGGPYLDLEYKDSHFTMWTTDAFEHYEENEVEEFLSMTVNFKCVDESTRTMVIWVSVIDTNNNAPQFRPTDELEFTIATPVPPGFLLTGGLNDMIVRDIDLTTQSIIFGIEENPYFEINFDASSSTTPKEFKATLRTKTLIRTLTEPLTLRISATDVDRTGDPPITTYGTIRIASDTDFQFPEEPIFSQIFYLADYTSDHALVHDPISLRQGYDEYVTFSLEGGYTEHFQIIQNGNQLSINVRTPLNSTTLLEQHIFLVVTAEREYTSGGATTIVIQLPEVISLEFETPHYKGRIINNNLELPGLILTQGYQDTNVLVSISGDYSSFFSAVAQENAVTVSMSPLNQNIILENNFIYLQVVATADRSSATAVVTLEIIKDDNVTPVFNKGIYSGTYEPEAGVTVEPIYFIQGFDESVSISLEGVHSDYFRIVQDGPNIHIRSSEIPPDIYSEQNIIISLEASKPRTVGANAALVIDLPEARKMEFESSSYVGFLQDNILTLQSILLSVGFDENVNFYLTGDYINYFTIVNDRNQVTLDLLLPLPDAVILDNNLLTFTLSARGLNAVTTTTNIVLEIIKEDLTTPQFSQNIYYGDYIGNNIIEFENIQLRQGYDDRVSFRIEGEHSQYFTLSDTANNVVISLRSAIPQDIIFNEKVISLNVIADKVLTVGANAAVLIRFPAELTDPAVMRFARNAYVGSLENERLAIEPILLSEGYASGTQFSLTGDYAPYFDISNLDNVISLTLQNTLPTEVMENNKFIILQIEAQRFRAVSVPSSIIIEIIKQEIIPPVFSEVYYRGLYEQGTGLEFKEQIHLILGHDNTVSYRLEGEVASLFSLVQNDNMLSLTLAQSPLPNEVLAENQQLLFIVVADKPNAVSGRAAISIELIKDEPELVILSFAQRSYVGVLQDNILQLPRINLIDSNQPANVYISGEYSSHFGISQENNIIRINLISSLTPEIIEENAFIVLNLVASYDNAISGYATIVIELAKDPEPVAPVFNQPYYTGEYSEQTGLIFDHTIQFTQGFDDTLTIALAGDDAEWFILIQTEPNNYILSLRDEELKVEDRSNLVFSIVASRPETVNTYATVVISITDFSVFSPIRFAQDFYTGTIDGNDLTLSAISLKEGHLEDLSYSLKGDYADYFQLVVEDGVFTLNIRTELPPEVIDANNMLILTLSAETDTASTHTNIILEVIRRTQYITVLEFEEAYYTGYYSTASSLVFNADMRLVGGYHEDVQYLTDGEHAQWFELVRTQNSVTLSLASAIPAEVTANNHQLIFVLTAQREGSVTARTTIVISLADDEITDGMTILGFERITYTGTIQNNVATLEPIVLSNGYSSNVLFSMFGDLEPYFSLTSQGSTVTIALRAPIPEEAIPVNRVIILEIQAAAPGAVSAHASVIFTIVTEDDTPPTVELIFNQAYYTGSYSETEGLTFATPISLAQGYDDTVEFALVGEQAQWFTLVGTQNSMTLSLTSAIPAAVIANNHQLIFVVTAQRGGSAKARTTVVISLTDDEITEGMTILGFERITYSGTIQNNVATLEPIVLSNGYSSNVLFSMFGDLEPYFSLTSQGSTVTIALRAPIPEEAIPVNRVIVLEIQAAAPGAVSAHASVIFTIVTEDDTPPTVELIFNQAYYTGSYSETEGLTFATPISLAQGYDDTVEFALVGEQAQWFTLVGTQNSMTLSLTSAIPAAVIANNHQLIFVVTAQRGGSATARTTVVISLTDDEITEGMTILGFERITYSGTIQNNVATLEPIVLSNGYSSNVLFSMFGDLEPYFSLTSQGSTVTIALRAPIPEEAIPVNRVIVLEIQAAAPGAVSAHASVIFTIVTEDDTPPTVELIFNQAYYTGSYSETEGLTFATPISLAQGYDDTVEFALVGEQAQWFTLVGTPNSMTLSLTSTIPAAVIANNHQLIFVVTAQRGGSATARTTVVISLTDDEITEGMTILGFERITYSGTIQNNVATLEPIVLSNGYSSNVLFSMFGDLEPYFSLTSQGSTVTIALRAPIPEEAIPVNRVIVLEIQAVAPGAVSAHASVIFTIVTEDDTPPTVELIFNQAYYTGSYSETEGLTFATPISLAQGYDDTVEFTLVGEQAQWFTLVGTPNSMTLSLTSAIPAAVIANNHQLIFVVMAQRGGSVTARTTVVISLTDDEITEGMTILGFERITYSGTIQNNVATLEPIVLSNGYSSNVLFSMFGDLEPYFSLTSQGSTVTIALRAPIPEEAIPVNGVIVLEIQAAAPGAVSAHASVIFTIVTENDTPPTVELIFNQAYYTGSYSETEGLTFATPISLAQGYDDTVEFALVGEQAQWFTLVGTQNSMTLSLTSAIPAAVIANNHQLIFVVTAQRGGSATARTTVVISLTDDEITEGMTILGFERITYTGTIQNNVATLEPIVLSNGYSSNVLFSMFGDLEPYFSLTSQGSTVTIALRAPIPEEAIPVNRVIVLEIQAAAPGAVSAHASVIFTIVTEDDTPPTVELIFNQAYYTGSYSETEGLTFATPISLAQGYDDTVEFALVGEQAQWFTLVGTPNSMTLSLTSAIPAAVIANNHQLIFVVTAQRGGSATARTTVVISLTDDEITEGMTILGFERITYSGTIQNNVATLEPIVLSNGYSSNVLFSMFGDLEPYFSLTSQGSTVTIALRAPIPEEAIPVNRVIVLEIQAAAPGAVSAHASVIFTIVTEDDTPPTVELIFNQAYYTGSYSETEGLTFATPISLAQGYDDTVEFALVGEQAQWFTLVGTQNSMTLSLTSAIPAAVIANNHQLIFVVTAQRGGSATARTTVVISLTDDEITEGMTILGFERITYSGTIQNNVATLEPIVLSNGYSSNVLFSMFGDLEPYFSLTSQGSTVAIALRAPIPEEAIPVNRVIVLEIQAAAKGAVSAHASVIFTIVTEDDTPPTMELIFNQAYYTGSYSETEGLTFATPISLAQGYDDTVEFALVGEQAQWFTLVGTPNSMTLSLTSAIPAAVIANNHQLIFVVTAQRGGSATARTTVVISLTDDEITEGMTILGFERITYSGTIQNNVATLEPIVLSNGYSSNVLFSMFGDLEPYFSLTSQGSTVAIALRAPIPEEAIPVNRVIVLEIQAAAKGAVSAHASVIFTIVTEDDTPPTMELIFNQAYYTGSYSETEGLTFATPISLAQGYDNTVEFALVGEQAQWFTLVGTPNSMTLSLTSAIPAAVIANNHQLIFVVTAQRGGSATARTTVVISLTDDEITEGMTILGFERITYSGTIQNNVATLEPIVLSNGYSSNVLFSMFGDLEPYFSLTSQGSTVTIALRAPIPEEAIPVNRVIVLEIQAAAPGAVSAHASVIFTIVTENDTPPTVELIFNQAYYTGSYSETEGLTFATPISLAQGYDDTVEFALVGEQAQWFTLVGTQNSMTLSLTSAIPAAVIANNHQLIFVVTAQRGGSATARTTVVISLTDDEITEGMTILGFERITYTGTIQNNVATLEPIVLSNGYSSNVLFSMFGDLEPYFSLTSQGSTVTIALRAPIPEEAIPVNRVIVLEIQAAAPGAVSAHASVIFTIVTEDDTPPTVELIFNQAYYTGSYSETEGLTFATPISLAQGYDDTVEFALVGEQAQWFTLVGTPNSMTLSLTSAIPAAVIANNHQLIFVVTAQRGGSATARTTVVISLTDDEITEGMTILGFERITYSGTIQNNVATLEPIVLSNGYSSNVLFSMFGDLEPYFSLTSQGSTVTIALRAPIPEEAIPVNGVIVLEIQAAAPGAVSAHASVIFTIVTEDDTPPTVELIFNQAYYTGSYSETEGLTFATPISLAQGYDDTVEFALVGEQAQWFTLVGTQNSMTLSLTSAIPAAVIANNHQLIFVVTAQRGGSATARTTVVISLTDDEITEGMTILGFERITYSGTIQNNVATLEPIVLSNGYSSNVLFSMFGDLEPYFSLTSQGSTVTIALRAPIPEEAIPVNGVIVLEIQAAAPGAVSAHASVIFTIVTEDDTPPTVELIFNQAYYTGSYSETEGLTFATPISIAQGYDDTVEFALVGEQAQWFTLVGTQNSMTLSLTSAIPAAVIANNHQLIFVVTAQRGGSATARTTVVISLTDDEITEGMTILGFERITYSGTIQNNVATLEPIVLSNGYSSNVLFSMFGDLEPYFSLTSQGSTVTIALRAPIPEEAIPVNRVIVLEIQAAAPGAVSAHASVIFTIVTEDDTPPTVELIFNQAYYTGSYSETEGLTFATPISLAQGYDDTVEFALVGEQAQWFTLVGTPNSMTLSLTSAIPAAVIANNHQLIFVVTAQRGGSTTARTTVVISLTDDEITEGMTILGFERITYSGTIQNNVATLEPIVLSNGYSSNVLFSMFGDLEPYFSLTSQGSTVTIALRAPIPEEAIPVNRVIVLEIQAAAPGAVSAHASVIFTIVTEDDTPPTVELIFNRAYYTGSYSETEGLTFATPISLAQGYDDTVEFALVGEQAQWFTLVGTQNSMTLSLTSAIPAAVIANNHQLIFVVTAQRGSSAARTTVVISFTDTHRDSDVRFEHVLYEGGIQNNEVRHENIIVIGFDGTNIQLNGEYAAMFRSSLIDNVVSIDLLVPMNLPDDITHIALEMHAGIARAVLLLNVFPSDASSIPIVSFSSSSYSLGVEGFQTGLIGHVQAIADNGESVRYTIRSDNAHLLERLSINNDGQLHLSAPANFGEYIFQVVATTVFTQAEGTAMVHMTVETVTACGDEIVVPPLIVLDRDEEEPHKNLVVLDATQHPNCRYILNNRWPVDQSWLYVDETGLHATAIDREHESIAFMALSQVQVELILQCDGDTTRAKRSASERPEWLGPYDYGTSNWILSDSISYNSRRSFVNLIVNDINDNAPIFVGKEHEPIAVGYPISELEELIMPRSLAELQATDADIGKNAELLYWSSENNIVVAPSTGFVHVRLGAQLEQDSRLVVHATDRNGEGHTGSIELIVKLLDISNILVVTVSDSFLDEENTILTEFSNALGYDVKVLRSTVISHNLQSDENDSSRKKRETDAAGAFLQLYIYGLIGREPVAVNRLATDINNNAIIPVSVVRTVSLEDHLEGQELCVIPGRDTGLMVSTIILSILLFLLLVLIAIWFILKRRRELNYEQFSDGNSVEARNDSLSQLPKADNVIKPRLNIEDLKKSERRLQEMLDAPLEEVKPHSSKTDGPFESILDMPTPEPHAPIVIQSIDKLKDGTDESEDDEFGERSKARRKSVVTFNENVEKIIHVEDNEDSSRHPGYEIYKL